MLSSKKKGGLALALKKAFKAVMYEATDRKFFDMVKQLEENWTFICDKVYNRDSYYHFYEENCFTVEVKETKTIVVIATATGELGS